MAGITQDVGVVRDDQLERCGVRWCGRQAQRCQVEGLVDIDKGAGGSGPRREEIRGDVAGERVADVPGGQPVSNGGRGRRRVIQA